MCSLLIVFLLVIETNAAQDIARPSRGFGDSVQVCSNERGAWRIRTHAADFTVDAQPLTGVAPDDLEAFAEREARERHGATILRKVTVIGADSRSGMRDALRRQHLAAFVEGPEAKPYAYWVPLSGMYRPQAATVPLPQLPAPTVTSTQHQARRRPGRR